MSPSGDAQAHYITNRCNGDPNCGEEYLGIIFREIVSEGAVWAEAVVDEFVFLPIAGSPACLIQENDAPIYFVRPNPNFANTYSVSGPISAIVTRTEIVGQSIYDIASCRWLGQSDQGRSVALNYSGRFIDINEYSGTFKWTVNGNPKIGNQDTPIGSYAGGFTVS